VAPKLAKLPLLKTLSLAGNMFCEDFACVLDDMIRAMPQLEGLDVEAMETDGDNHSFGPACLRLLDRAAEAAGGKLVIRR
jgi:hypothetical protein